MARGYTLQITANESSYSSVNNTSSVSVTVKANSPVETAYGAWKYGSTTLYITCNGAQRAVTVPSYDFRTARTLTLGSLTFENIQHNADGTKTISISSSWYADNTYVQDSNGNTTLSASTTLKLTDIPRQALIKGADNFNDEQNPTITYNNLAGDNVTSLQACISLTGATDDIAYRNIPINGTSYTFNLTDAERTVLRNATTNGNSRTVMFFVKTVLNGITYHSTLSRTLTIVNANPTLGTITYQDTNSAVTAITTNNQHIVQNKSTLRVSFTAPTLKKGATLVNHTFSLNNVNRVSTANSGYVDFGTVNSATNLTLTVTVSDSRGNVAKTTKTITIFEYKAPTATVTLNRLNNYEDTSYLTVDAEIASVNNKNTMVIKYKYKLKGGEYGSETTIEDDVKQTLTLDKNNEYIFNITVTDALGGTFTQEYTLPKGVFPLFIDTQKNSIGINCLPTHSKSLEVVSDIYFNGTKLLDLIYPVGSVYISTNNVSPQTFFGGVWEAFATGRTLVGIDTSQTEFKTVGLTGGEKAHQLTSNEMPSHAGHMYDNFNDSGWVDRGGDTNSYYLNSTGASGYGQYENRPYKVVSGNELVMQGYTKGGNATHNNLQPYVVVYMWKRKS